MIEMLKYFSLINKTFRLWAQKHFFFQESKNNPKLFYVKGIKLLYFIQKLIYNIIKDIKENNECLNLTQRVNL